LNSALLEIPKWVWLYEPKFDGYRCLSATMRPAIRSWLVEMQGILEKDPASLKHWRHRRDSADQSRGGLGAALPCADGDAWRATHLGTLRRRPDL